MRTGAATENAKQAIKKGRGTPRPSSLLLLLFCAGDRFQSRCNYRVEERHHCSQFQADLFDRLLLFGFAARQKVRAALFVFFNPGFGEAAITNTGKEFFHILASLQRHDTLSGVIIAVLGGVADGLLTLQETTAKMSKKCTSILYFPLPRCLLTPGLNSHPFLHEISLQISSSRISLQKTHTRKSQSRS